MKVEGVVKNIRQKEKNYFIEINDEWYSGFGKCPFIEGEMEIIEYQDKEYNGKVYHNIKASKTYTDGKKPQYKTGDNILQIDYDEKLKDCLLRAMVIAEDLTEPLDSKLKLKWKTEDIRAIGVSLFIQESRR